MLLRSWRPLGVASLVVGAILAASWARLGADVRFGKPSGRAPTFYRDILPILQKHCQSCHRAEGIAPMAFESYEQTIPFLPFIRRAVEEKTMPPWFADPQYGHFANDWE